MSKEPQNINTDFENILLLIQEARNRVYAKANAELVLLYFNVGKAVSAKVSVGSWGENTVQELADFIASKHPELSGFNRRGLYRMKQFYETYSVHSECFLLWLSVNHVKALPMTMPIENVDNEQITKVSAVRTQIEDEKHHAFLNDILLRLILSKTNSAKVSVGSWGENTGISRFHCLQTLRIIRL